MYTERHLKDYLKASHSFSKGNYVQALKDAFIRVDETLRTSQGKKELNAISAALRKDKEPDIMCPRAEDTDLANGVGCTACVALITPTDIFVANSGDSRCVFCRKGVAVAMSEDHKPELDRERKRIEKAGGTIEDGRINGVLNLSRSLGDLEYKQNARMGAEDQMITCVPDIKVERRSADTEEFLIIACDGVWDCMTNEKAAATVRAKIWNAAENRPAKVRISKAIGEMMDKIVAVDLDNPAGIGCDNMTCVVVQFLK